MTDAEISRRLALAIGYAPKDIGRFNPPHDMRIVVPFGNGWRLFSYKSPSVIWPIAERFNCFPEFDGSEWRAWTIVPHFADTAAKAVALALIKAYEGSKT